MTADPDRSPRISKVGWGSALIVLGVLAGCAVLGIAVGAVDLPIGSVVVELLDKLPGVDIESGLSERQAAILWELRVPRVILAGMVGGMLAMAGAGFQGVFRNPLADPYLLGVAAGAGLGATLAIAYLPNESGWPVSPLPVAAFAGAVLGVAVTYALGRSATRTYAAATLILAGVAVAAFLTATQTFIQQENSETFREVFAWIMGALGTVGWREVTLILPYVIVSALGLLLYRRLMDVMGVGDEEADSVGIKAARVRLVVVAAATLGTAAAVAVSGLIGFVGIIVPHAIRLVLGSSYRIILPLSLGFGAAFLIIADLIARTVIAPAEIPIGVITAFFGAPFFLVVLMRARKALVSSIGLVDLAVAYNGRRVVDGVSMHIEPRTWVALIGPNGAGKSTLLRAVASLVPFAGQIDIGGMPTSEMTRRQLSELVAFLPQRPVMPEGVTVADYVAIGRTPYIPYWGTEALHDREIIAGVLERLELTTLADRQIDTLSGGEAQRVVLARALTQQSEILLLDEPTSAPRRGTSAAGPGADRRAQI